MDCMMDGSVYDGAFSIRYTYNADGIRTSKTSYDVTHHYYLNGSQILSPIAIKCGVVKGQYLVKDLTNYKVVPLAMDDFLSSTGGKVLSYGLAVFSWALTVNALLCEDPNSYADWRGYRLK